MHLNVSFLFEIGKKCMMDLLLLGISWMDDWMRTAKTEKWGKKQKQSSLFESKFVTILLLESDNRKV